MRHGQRSLCLLTWRRWSRPSKKEEIPANHNPHIRQSAFGRWSRLEGVDLVNFNVQTGPPLECADSISPRQLGAHSAACKFKVQSCANVSVASNFEKNLQKGAKFGIQVSNDRLSVMQMRKNHVIGTDYHGSCP